MRTNMAKLLVTGASGFLGRAILERAPAWSLEAVPVFRHSVDHSDAQALAALLERMRPDYAIDAAGVLPGRGDVASNLTLTEAWIETLGRVGNAPRLILVGSAAIYGTGAARDRATREDDPRQPLSDYGRVKRAALELGCAAHRHKGHDIQTAIVFNLMGRGQPDHLAPQVFINKALAARGGSYEVGAVDAVRDFMDVEDAADALIAMARHGRPGDVMNVATGRPTRIRDLLDEISARIGAGWASGHVPVDTSDGDICYGDPARLAARTGWQPRHDFDTALGRAITAARTEWEARKNA